MSDHPTSAADAYQQKLKNIRRVANQSADIHSLEADRLSWLNNCLTAGGLVSSAFLLLFSLPSDDFIQRTVGIAPDAYRWVLALLAFLTFAGTLLQIVFQPGALAALHRRAVSRYARAKHQADLCLRGEGPLTQQAVDEILDKYLDDTDLPKIPERRFNKLKRKHLIKVAVSAALSENPHRSIRSIRRELARSAALHEVAAPGPK